MDSLDALHRHLSDWPVVSAGTSARLAKRRWAGAHPGVLGGYCPGSLVDAYPSLSTPLRVAVLQALLCMAPADEVAARTVLQLVAPVVWYRVGRYRARVGSAWATMDELVCDAVTETWRIIQHQPGLWQVQYPAPKISDLLGGRLRCTAVSWDREQRRRTTVEADIEFVRSRATDEELTVIEEVRQVLLDAHQARMITTIDAAMVWDRVVLDVTDRDIAVALDIGTGSGDARRQHVQHRRQRVIGQLNLYAQTEAAAA